MSLYTKYTIYIKIKKEWQKENFNLKQNRPKIGPQMTYPMHLLEDVFVKQNQQTSMLNRPSYKVPNNDFNGKKNKYNLLSTLPSKQAMKEHHMLNLEKRKF